MSETVSPDEFGLTRSPVWMAQGRTFAWVASPGFGVARGSATLWSSAPASSGVEPGVTMFALDSRGRGIANTRLDHRRVLRVAQVRP